MPKFFSQKIKKIMLTKYFFLKTPADANFSLWSQKRFFAKVFLPFPILDIFFVHF